MNKNSPCPFDVLKSLYEDRLCTDDDFRKIPAPIKLPTKRPIKTASVRTSPVRTY